MFLPKIGIVSYADDNTPYSTVPEFTASHLI